MSDRITLGELPDAHGDPIEVRLWTLGPAIELYDRAADCTRLVIDDEGRDKLRELLDRAAMPGQPGEARDGG